MATMNKIENISFDDLKSYDIGYRQLDGILNGLKEGTVITIGARPAMGKTIFINNIVLHLLKRYNLPTLYISLETGKENLLFQLASVNSCQSYQKIRNNKEVLKQITNELFSKKYNLNISDDCVSISDLEQLIEENKNIKFLVIDYIQLMKSDKSFTSSTDAYNDVLDRIRILATKYKLIVFMLSQVSRNVEYRTDKRPLLMDLKNSGNLESNSDILMFLYRDSYYKESSKKEKNDLTEIIVVKNRYGYVATTYLDYDKEQSRFIDY